ncbi:hypothetical protein COU57_06250 [Candidatus Pacearchaeota archaeon CG10_big_fil_rev_8_21_14_0_10_32_14]|nr:MAG: hypothetical protein COU57_06250 [Candidatus Pacearchaeota archaeon CG10_big_fil_rev_8_21_14_0_10_32_14]
MRKTGVLIFFLLTINLLLVPHLISSQLPEDTKEKIDNVADTADQIFDEDSRNEFIKQKWTTWSQNSSAGKSLKNSEVVIKKADIAWKIIFGLSFSWSFLFILVLVLWIFAVINLFRIFQGLYDSVIRNQIIAIIITIVISAIGITKAIGETIINLISNLPNLFFQIFAYIFVIVVLFVISIYTGIIKSSAYQNRVYASTLQSKRNEKKIKKLEKDLKDRDSKSNKRDKEQEEDESIEDLARSEIEGMGQSDEDL